MSEPGHDTQCLYNAQSIASHDTQLRELRERLEKMEKNQDKLAEILNKIREKIFDGYDESLRHTSSRVDEIMDAVKTLSERGGVGVVQVQTLIDAAVLAYDKKEHQKEAAKEKWLKHHRIEVLSAFVGVCMAIVTIFTILRG